MPERVSDKYCNNSAVTLLHDNVIMKQNLLKTPGKPDFNMFFSHTKLFNCILQQTRNSSTEMNKQMYSSKNNTFYTKLR